MTPLSHSSHATHPTANLALVMGLGRFGGGLGVTRFLVSQGYRVRLTDLGTAESLRGPLEALQPMIADGRVELRLGGHDQADFASADLVVANPAVPHPWDNPFLNAADAAGRPITTEMRLLVERLDRRQTIGITGSAGKSTTSAMVAVLLKGLGVRVHFGGNIGGSLLVDLEQIGRDDRVVLELSSFMLHWLGAESLSNGPGWSPGLGAITNIRPNHLDWHGSFEHYEQSKLNLLRFMLPGDVALRGDDPLPAELTRLDLPLRVPGAHNRENALLAIRLACAATGCSPREAAPHLDAFTGLPHRLELIADQDGRRYINDSKSTTPDATLLAVAAFDDPGRVHLIAGGYDKKSDLGPIAALAPALGGLYAIGTTAAAISGGDPAREMHTLARAVATALPRMGRGDVLLLSPGCASWDQFENYEERGRVFTELVRSALGQSALATPSGAPQLPADSSSATT